MKTTGTKTTGTKTNETISLSFLEEIENTKVSKNSNTFGASNIYKSIEYFQKENPTYLKSDGITLNRNKIRKHFQYFLNSCCPLQTNYKVKSKDELKQFLAFCKGIYKCFDNPQNLLNPNYFNLENMCKTNQIENQSRVKKQLENIAEFIKENF